MKRRIVLGVEYDGSGFCGWQTQPSGCAVQDVLEAALARMANERISTICAGRTDAGVHALGQVVHFDTEVTRPLTAWVRGVNAFLPDTLAVVWAAQARDDFHARFSATSRVYRYVLLNHPVRPAADSRRVGWCHQPLDLDQMRAAAGYLIGRHDFSAFRSSECQAASPVRELRRIAIERRGDYFGFEFEANGFLHHMVRNIMGSLLAVGRGANECGWLRSVLASRDRNQAAPTFEASGLYLLRVEYGEEHQLPGGVRSLWP